MFPIREQKHNSYSEVKYCASLIRGLDLGAITEQKIPRVC